MKKQEIHDFLEHVKERQIRYGPESAFRFRVYQRKGLLHPAVYLDTSGSRTTEVDDEAANQVPQNNEVPVTQSSLPSAADIEVAASHQPAASHEIDDSSNVYDFIVVNHEQMMALVSRGMQPVQPANGPNEGEPHYKVPAAALMYLNCE